MLNMTNWENKVKNIITFWDFKTWVTLPETAKNFNGSYDKKHKRDWSNAQTQVTMKLEACRQHPSKNLPAQS